MALASPLLLKDQDLEVNLHAGRGLVYFLKVETSCQQSEQKYPSVRIIIHSLLIKKLLLCSYSLGLLLLKIEIFFCDVSAARVLRLRCCFEAAARGRKHFSPLSHFGQWLSFWSLLGHFFSNLSFHWIITDCQAFHNASLRNNLPVLEAEARPFLFRLS